MSASTRRMAIWPGLARSTLQGKAVWPGGDPRCPDDPNPAIDFENLGHNNMLYFGSSGKQYIDKFFSS